jgi:hypothetical protein
VTGERGDLPRCGAHVGLGHRALRTLDLQNKEDGVLVDVMLITDKEPTINDPPEELPTIKEPPREEPNIRRPPKEEPHIDDPPTRDPPPEEPPMKLPPDPDRRRAG